jgi:hypothetical protein
MEKGKHHIEVRSSEYRGWQNYEKAIKAGGGAVEEEEDDDDASTQPQHPSDPLDFAGDETFSLSGSSSVRAGKKMRRK